MKADRDFSVTLPDGFDTPIFRTLADHVAGMPLAGGLPAFAALDLMAMYRWAPNLYVIDVKREDDGEIDFVVRFAGTQLVEILDQEPTGKSLRVVNIEQERDEIIGIYADMVVSRRPSASLTTFVIEDPSVLGDLGRKVVALRRLVFPLTETGATVDHFVGALVRLDGLGGPPGFVKMGL